MLACDQIACQIDSKWQTIPGRAALPLHSQYSPSLLPAAKCLLLGGAALCNSGRAVPVKLIYCSSFQGDLMCKSSIFGGGMTGGCDSCQRSTSASMRGFNVASNLRRWISRFIPSNGDRVENLNNHLPSAGISPFLLSTHAVL